MSDRLHIIITTEAGSPKTLLYSKKRITVACIAAIVLFCTLATGSFFTSRYFLKSKNLSNQVADLTGRLEEINLANVEYSQRIEELEALNDSQLSLFQEEKAELLNSAVSELSERSQLIETVMHNIGVKLEDIHDETDSSGGPFIAAEDAVYSDLLFRSDKYLEAIKTMPLGRPIPGPITSRYGHRTDPVNGKKAYHSGVDMRGRPGTPVRATADGVVTRAGFNGSFGRYVEINHQNGFTSAFAHLKKYKVKKGQKVKRGDTIALVGSSGRSTGPHLHYEVRYNGTPVNPRKMMATMQLLKEPTPPKILTAAKKVQPTTSLR